MMLIYKKVLFLVLFLVNEPLLIYCHELPECPEPTYMDKVFKKTSENSKYLYHPLADFVNFTVVEKMCGEMNLEMAEITSYEDYFHLNEFIFRSKLLERNWALGMTDNVKEGYFKDRSRLPIRFQTFWFNEPNDWNHESNCVLFARIAFDKFGMFDTPCNSTVFPLCQYKADDMCNQNSPQSVAARLIGDNFTFIGATPNRNYYFSQQQKGWEEALRFCHSNGKKLLDFRDATEMEVVTNFLKDFEGVEGMFLATAVWTSGQFLNLQQMEPSGYYMKWQTTDVTFGTQRIFRGFWDWIPGEPSDSSKIGLETCVAMYAWSPRPPYVLKKFAEIIPFFAVLNCYIPYHFICYEDVEFQPVPKEEVETRSKAKKGKAMTNSKKKICLEVTPPKINISKPGFEVEEIIELMAFNSKHQLHHEGTNLKLQEVKAWRKPIINAIVDITKKMCPSDLVSRDFVNLIKNMMLIYYNNKEYPSIIDEWMWDEFKTDLANCLAKIKPFSEVKYKPPYIFQGFILPNTTTLIRVHPPEEKIDAQKFAIDMILDAFWFMFNLSAGACMNTIENYSKTTWISDYFYRFTEDFIDGFAQRWFMTKDENYGAFLGDVDLGTAMFNLRACSAAVYELNGIFNLYLARPITMPGPRVPDTLNFKTGEPLAEIVFTP